MFNFESLGYGRRRRERDVDGGRRSEDGIESSALARGKMDAKMDSRGGFCDNLTSIFSSDLLEVLQSLGLPVRSEIGSSPSNPFRSPDSVESGSWDARVVRSDEGSNSLDRRIVVVVSFDVLRGEGRKGRIG